MGSNIVRLEQEVFFVGVGDPNYVILPSDKSTPRLEKSVTPRSTGNKDIPHVPPSK